MPVFTNKIPKAEVPEINLMPDTKKPTIDTKQMSYVFETEEAKIGEEGQWFGSEGKDMSSRPKSK